MALSNETPEQRAARLAERARVNKKMAASSNKAVVATPTAQQIASTKAAGLRDSLTKNVTGLELLKNSMTGKKRR
jgi:hypothetical protein